VLMFSGILRWKGSRERGGIWWLLYTQVSLAYPAADRTAFRSSYSHYSY
jgi:hypothetical protein